MTFLSPLTALFAAAVAVPLLLLLYFLKLRRRRLRMASTLLWAKSFEDLQANVPFQRLRFSALLLLQLLLLALLLLALAEPALESENRPASRIILLFDRSASMNAMDGDETGERSRLDAARDAAKQIIEGLATSSRASRVLIIAFGARAQLVTGFESRPELLIEAIDGIEPTDEQADLSAALRLAAVFAGQGEDAGDEPPSVMLISDGGVAPAEDGTGFTLRSGRFSHVLAPERLGEEGSEPVRNVGIVSLSARRDYDDPTQVLVFGRLINVGPNPADTLVTLLVDGEAGPMKKLSIPRPSGDTDPLPPGEATVSFAIDLPTGAVLSLRHNEKDSLKADDTAAVILPAPGRPRIGLVHPGSDQQADETDSGNRDGAMPTSGGGGPDPFLMDLLEAMDPEELRPMTIEGLLAEDAREIDLGRVFDLLVFDRVAPQRLPGVGTITFGTVPAGIETIAPASEGGRRILSWQRDHPVMRHVSLDTIVYAGFGGMDLPAGATPLAEGPEGPVIALIPARGAKHIVVGYELIHSNWPLHVSAAVFLQNVMDYLTLSRTGQTSLAVRPGEPITVRVSAEADELLVTGPSEQKVDAAPADLATLPALRSVGLYTVEGAERPLDQLAVSMLSDVESDIRPRADLVVNAEAAAAGRAAAATSRDLWPYFAGAALALLVLEWLLYCRLSRM